MTGEPLVTIGVYTTRGEAEFAKAILESHDIEAIIQADDCGGIVTNCELQVMASSEALAKELLETPNGYDGAGQPEPIGTAEGRNRPVPGVAIFLMGLLMGGLVGAVAVYSHNEKRSHYTGTYTKDNDGDGRSDEWYEYKDGNCLQVSRDRDRDGKPDVWDYYENSKCVRSEADENFDGKPDGWAEFKDGNIIKARADADFDGVPDIFLTYQNGIVASWEARPHSSDKVLARCEYKNGLRYRLLIDTNDDGRFDEEETYNPFGLVEKTAKIPSP